MTLVRTLAAVCLALILTATSGAMAVARGQMAAGPGMTLVICIGDGTETIRLDANGDPVAAHHACPDCVLAGFAPALDQTRFPVRADPVGVQSALPVPPILWIAAPRAGGHPRAPPLIV